MNTTSTVATMHHTTKAQARTRRTGRTQATQRGISIMSVLLGLVIAALVAVVAFNQFSDAQRKTRIEAATGDISAIISEAQKTYGAANQYGAVTTAIAVQGGVVPTRLRVAGTNTAQNKYNGAITLAPATITTANDSLALGYANVRREDCQDLVIAVEPQTRGITVAGTDVKANDGALVLATLGTQCDSAANVDLIFRFGRQ